MLSMTVGTDVPEQSTTHRLMTTCSAFQDLTTPFLSRWVDIDRACESVRAPHAGSDRTWQRL